MINPFQTIAGWLPNTSSTPTPGEASRHGGQRSSQTQPPGSVELPARTRTAEATATEGPPIDRRIPLTSLRRSPSGRDTLPPAEVPREGSGTWDFIPLSPRGTAAGVQGSPGSSSSEDSSHAFLSARYSMPLSMDDIAVSVSGRAETVAPPGASGSQPLRPRVEVLRDELAAALGKMPFITTVPAEGEEEQLVLQDRYLDRAAQIAALREEAFGTTQPYQLRASMTTQTKEGSLAAVYEGFQSFVTSSFRSPSGGATGLSLVGDENIFPIDQALITATVQGALAYAAEGAMTAMNNRATLSNMPKIARNKFEDLFYEHGVKADTVLLVVTQGDVTPGDDGRRKEFMRAGDPRAPTTPEALAEQATRKLSAIKLRQELWDGKSFAFPLVPLMSGGFNTLRRFISSAKTLNSPLPLFVTSALASGSASGVVKLGLELGKTRAQVEIDDLMGGTQAVNLFRLSRPRADVEPVRWSDAGATLGGLGRFLGESAWESLALAGEATRTFGHSAVDLGFRYMLVNGFANGAGMGFGGLVGQLFRTGRHFGALPGESPQSRANIAGQMAQSTFGDAFWRGMKEVMKGRELDANASLKLSRTTRMAGQVKDAVSAQHDLRTQAGHIPEGSAVWMAQRLVEPVPEGTESHPVDIEAHGSLHGRLTGGAPLNLRTLQDTQAALNAWQGTRAELGALNLRDATPEERKDRNDLTRQVDKLIKLLHSHAASQQWLEPKN